MQSDFLKNSINIYIKIAPTCFGTVTPSLWSALFVLVKVTLVKIAKYGTSVCVNSVVMWLHVLEGPYWCVYVALFGSRLNQGMRSLRMV
jgi:hypothetical protein